MAVNKVILGDQTLIDLTADSVTPDKLFKGITAHNMKGESIVGTMEGGSTPSEPSDNTAVIFADYDGNLIDTWTWDEVASKTALPTPPAHTGLVFEGWNWTLEDIKTDTTGQVITVGPYYHTESGLTEIDIEVNEINGMNLQFPLFEFNYNTIDWGDGVVTEKVDRPSHIYENSGNYTVKISNYNGQNTLFHCNFVNGTYYNVNSYIIKAIRYNSGVNSKGCLGKGLKYVTIPKSLINIEKFDELGNCIQFTVPMDARNNSSQFKGKKLKYIAMPKRYYNYSGSVTSIGNSAFYGCSSLQNITIPESVTSIENNAFYGCSSLQNITIPESVTSIENNAFSNCSSLQNINIPSNVTSIGNSAFSNCSSINKAIISSSADIKSSAYEFKNYTEFDFSKCKSIPVLESTSNIGDVQYVSVIYVPLSLYYEWKEATNWAAYASKIQPKGEGIGAFNGVSKLAYNESATLTANYASDTEPTNITITASNPDALEIGQYTIDNTAKTITIPVTAKNVTDTVTVTFSATFKDGVQSRTLSIKIKESFKTPSFTVTDVEGASYNFVLNDAGYYESTNKKVANSAALCKLDITDLEDTTKVIFDCINSGEANYDYGMISKINTTLGTTNSEDSASNLFVNFKGQSSTSVVTKSYPINNVAACYFTLKYRKDGSGDQGNDSLQFKVRFE